MRAGSKKLWWLEIFLPLFLGAVVWVALSLVIYGGGIRDRLSSQAERYFIEDALRASRYEARNKDVATIVSLTEKDWEAYPQARMGEYRDASLDVYARVLERILKAKPKRVFLSWLPSAHDPDERSLRKLTEVVLAREAGTKLYIVYSAGEKGSLPQALRNDLDVLDGDDCHYDVMSYCSFWSEWSRKWIIQVLAEVFWEFTPKGIPRGHLSWNLPHTLPNYLVHLPDAASIPTMSFSDVLEGDDLIRLKNRTVFIGTTLVQDVPPPYNPVTLWRTFTVHDPREQGLAKGGTPYHIFWAQLAQMFIDRKSIRVVSFEQEIALLMLFCAGIWLLLWRLPAPFALCYYVGGAVCLFFVNRLLLSRFQLYLPVFDIIYAGFFCFLYPAFGMMSYEIYRRWQLEAQTRALQQSDVLKSNFVSLISHNLNTPVARMQGLVDLLMAQPEARPVESVLVALRREIVRLQLCVRAALVGSALEDGSRHEKTVSLKRIVEEFQEGAAPLLERLGIKVVGRLEAPDDDWVFLPVRMDLRVLIFSLAGIFALCGPGMLTLSWSIGEGQAGAYQIKARLQGNFAHVWELWVADELALGFFERTLIRFFRQFLRLYHGHLKLDEHGVANIEWQVEAS